jgi:hypothetical protein
VIEVFKSLLVLLVLAVGCLLMPHEAKAGGGVSVNVLGRAGFFQRQRALRQVRFEQELRAQRAFARAQARAQARLLFLQSSGCGF